MNIHGFCPHCNANLDGELIISYALESNKSKEEALSYAKSYEGWDRYGELNRWGRVISLYDIKKDKTTAYRCLDCENTWERK